MGSNFDQELLVKVKEKKVVFILDQFERFFFLPEDKKENIRNLIIGLCRRNTALILSMREEYLADFMKEFDVNNRIPGMDRDAERFVVGSDGSIYYTDSHYGDEESPRGFPPFVRIK